MRTCPVFLISQLKLTTSTTFTSSPPSNDSKEINDSEKSNDSENSNDSEKKNDSKNSNDSKKEQGLPPAGRNNPSTQVFKARDTVQQLNRCCVN